MYLTLGHLIFKTNINKTEGRNGQQHNNSRDFNTALSTLDRLYKQNH